MCGRVWEGEYHFHSSYMTADGVGAGLKRAERKEEEEGKKEKDREKGKCESELIKMEE